MLILFGKEALPPCRDLTLQSGFQEADAGTPRRGDDPELQQAGRVVNRRGKRGKRVGRVVGMWQGCQQSRGSGKHRMHNKSRSAAGAVVCAIGAVLVGVILIGVILRRRLVAAWLWRGTAGST